MVSSLLCDKGTRVLKGFVTAKHCGFEMADEQGFKCVSTLAEELIPQTTLFFWLISKITQFQNSVGHIQYTYTTARRMDTHTQEQAYAHIHTCICTASE